MRFVQARGSFYEVGLKVGEACKSDIPKVYKRMVKYLLEHTSVGTEDRIHEVAKRHMDAAKKLWSPSVQFLRGLAKGAKVKVEVIALMSFSEEVSSEFLPASNDKCSTLVVRMPNGNRLIVHNEDYEPYNFGKMVLLDVVFNGYPRLICLTYMGMLPSLAGSLNSCGIAITNNGLWPEAVVGLPKQVLHFRASLARNMRQAKSWLAKQPNSVTTHYVVAHGPTHKAVSLTVSNSQTASRNIILHQISGLPFCHTNHVIDGDLGLKEPDPAPELSKHTVPRYKKLKGLKPNELPRTPQGALSLFATNDGLIHRTPEQNPTSVTLATVVICPESLEMWVRDADPKARKKDWYFSL